MQQDNKVFNTAQLLVEKVVKLNFFDKQNNKA